MVGFVGGIAAAILVGMPIYQTQGELIGTLSIVAISGITVLVAGLIGGKSFDLSELKKAKDEIPAAPTAPAGSVAAE
jgi:high-affinity Fe2+/Pb2+ permease